MKSLCVAAALTALCLRAPVPAFAEPPQSIGVSLPLSGDGANEGRDLKNLLIFANDKLAGGRYRLRFEDDRCNDRDAVSVAQKLVSLDRVHYALGFACSGAVLAAAPVYEKGHVLTIAVATGAPAIAEAGDYIFRTMPNLTTAAVKLAA